MCILSKLDYVKFGVCNLSVFQKLSKKNLWGVFLGKGRVNSKSTELSSPGTALGGVFDSPL